MYPVSYTHLDVYKRQVQKMLTIQSSVHAFFIMLYDKKAGMMTLSISPLWMQTSKITCKIKMIKQWANEHVMLTKVGLSEIHLLTTFWSIEYLTHSTVKIAWNIKIHREKNWPCYDQISENVCNLWKNKIINLLDYYCQ